MKKIILLLSIFCVPILTTAQFWEQHWNTENYIFSGSGGDALTVTQTVCEEALVQVTDPVGAALPAFSPIIINPQDANGDDITDISANPISFTLRARSAEQVVVGALFRSDDGGSDFRTAILYDTIPAGLDTWTEITIEFTGDDISGFNANNLRDFWFFLDRGTENFAGNEFYIDYISLGGAPTPGLESPCDPPGNTGELTNFWEQHWNTENYVFSGSGGDALTVTQTDCEEALVQVTDPVGAALPAFSPIIINPQDANGDDITDISANPISFTLRARSAEQVVVGALFRSDDGGSDFRTAILYDTIPAGLDAWTEITIEFTGDDISGFNAGNLRDFWFFLDRGTENFAGNEFYIDYISLGGAPTSGLESPCQLGSGDGTPIFAEYFDGDMLQSINTGSIAGEVTTFTLDTDCETLQISVTDPVNNPLPPFNAYQVDPLDANGNEITDISGNVNVTMRVRSAEAINIDVLFRSGEGGTSERSDRKSVAIPGGLETWTNFTIEFAEVELAGFNPADLRDMWFYLDRGTENFSGNEFYIDHISIGGAPDITRNSPCTTDIQPQTWLENWDTENSVTIGGSETVNLTVTTTECEEVKIEVTDPEMTPHQAFRPIVINPMSTNGSDITNISGNVQLVIRARSAAEVPIGVLFRSGDGSADFRTATLTQTVAGTLEAWTTLTYTFTADDLGGFNPEDLVDFWIFLDRENNNFPGNEIYFDYIAIGEQPAESLNSPCGLPDVTVSTNEPKVVSFFDVFPNPAFDQLQIRFDADFSVESNNQLRLFDAFGRVLLQQNIAPLQNQIALALSDLPRGIFYVQIRNDRYQFTRRFIKQ